MEEEKKMEEERKMEEIGVVTGFFAHPCVGVIELTKGSFKIGDKIYIKGHTTEFEQVAESMQLENQPVQEATKGQSIGVKVKERVRRHDVVYKLIE